MILLSFAYKAPAQEKLFKNRKVSNRMQTTTT